MVSRAGVKEPKFKHSGSWMGYEERVLDNNQLHQSHTKAHPRGQGM